MPEVKIFIDANNNIVDDVKKAVRVDLFEVTDDGVVISKRKLIRPGLLPFIEVPEGLTPEIGTSKLDSDK